MPVKLRRIDETVVRAVYDTEAAGAARIATYSECVTAAGEPTLLESQPGVTDFRVRHTRHAIAIPDADPTTALAIERVQGESLFLGGDAYFIAVQQSVRLARRGEDGPRDPRDPTWILDVVRTCESEWRARSSDREGSSFESRLDLRSRYPGSEAPLVRPGWGWWRARAVDVVIWLDDSGLLQRTSWRSTQPRSAGWFVTRYDAFSQTLAVPEDLI
jgi:hypothetical protein